MPEDLRWEYGYLYGGDGRLKSMSEIRAMPADRERGENPVSDVVVLYGYLTDRYGHPPTCGEPYPKGNSGRLNLTALDHKALSCSTIPDNLREKYAQLFDRSGRLKSWSEIQVTPASGGSMAVNTEDMIPSLRNEVEAVLGHPISCPS
ncbi:hypothetical protein AB0L82_21455 [Nocardia sp. NPDC052001]|uniref:hypothetical protein n=1 Tax=Nocardia sp. NPDC052001 TaxID=3154853 RepID=UPI00341FE350